MSCGNFPYNSRPVIYDKLARFYDPFFKRLDDKFLSQWRAETLSLLPENARILEIGAGTGLNFEYYPESRRATASEISIKMLEFAKRRADRIDLVQADAESLPFAENSFDAALATLVFCSIPDPAAAFAELKRTVIPDGKIVLLEHVRPGGALGFAFDVLNVFTVALIEDHFNRETARAAEAAGLKIVEVRKKAAGIVNLITCRVVK